MPEPTDDQLALLLDLQRTDHLVRKLEHQLDALPEQQVLDAASAQVTELEGQLAELTAELSRAEAEAETLSRDIDTLTARRDADRVRLYDGSVTNQREMSSVEAEIQTSTHRIEEHEEDLLVVLERVEELEGRRDAVAAALDEARGGEAEAETGRDTAAKELLARLGEAKARRDREAAELPDDLRERYEQAAARGGGTGVGELDHGACSACRLDFSMADLDELYRGPALTTCPQCRRLLVVARA